MKSKHIDWTLCLKCDHQIWAWPWIFKVKYRICYISAKNGPIATKQKANVSNELKASNVTSGFDLGHDLDHEFSRSNMLFLSQKWSDCHETKSKYIDWTLGLKCDHQISPWPWPWPWIFRNKCRICNILTKSSPIAAKRRGNISIELQASNVTSGFDLDHDHDLWIFKVKFDLDIWPHTWPWPWIAVSQNGRADWHWIKGVGVGHSWPMDHDHDNVVTKVRCKDLLDSDRGDFRCRRAVDSFHCSPPNLCKAILNICH